MQGICQIDFDSERFFNIEKSNLKETTNIVYLIDSIQACCMTTLYLIGKRDKAGSVKRWECSENRKRFFLVILFHY